jgi:hypothetical protein
LVQFKQKYDLLVYFLLLLKEQLQQQVQPHYFSQFVVVKYLYYVVLDHLF